MAFNYEATGFMFILISFINIYFIMDVIFSFFTGYMEDGVFDCRLKKIAIRYATTWMILDVISSIPWEWINFNDADSLHTGEALKILRFMKAFRLLRITRLLQLMRKGTLSSAIEVVIESNGHLAFAFGILRVVFLLLAITHWGACCWFYIGSNPADDDKTDWITTNIGGIQDLGTRYMYAIYFILTTMTTVGYGDMTPTNGSEVQFGLVLLLVATVVFAGLMGSLTDLISNLNNEANEQNARKAALSRYMHWRALPRHLFMDVREHLLFLWEKNEFDEAYEDEIKEQLSPSLKKELCYHVYGKILRHAPFLGWLKGCEVCLKELSTKVVTVFLAKGDALFHVGQPNENIYMLLKGTLHLSQNENFALFQGTEDASNKDYNAFEIPRNKKTSIADVLTMFFGSQKKPIDKKTENNDAGQKRSVSVILEMFRPTERWWHHAEDLDEEEVHPDPEDSLNRSVDSSVLHRATRRLDRLDFRHRHAAVCIQRRWRRFHGKLFLASMSSGESKVKILNGFQSKLVHAPAYLGESCLWHPLSEWDSEALIIKNYAAKAETRVELAYFTRGHIQEVLELFSPWLGDRFKVFQRAVREIMMESGGLERQDSTDLASDRPESDLKEEVGCPDQGQPPTITDRVASDFPPPPPLERKASPTTSKATTPRVTTPAVTPRVKASRAITPRASPRGGRFRNAAAAALARVQVHVNPPPGVSPDTQARMNEMQTSGPLYEPLLRSSNKAA